MSLHYPLIFHYGKKGWHMRILLAGIDLANNVNLQARRHTYIEEGGDEDVPGDDTPHYG